MLSKDIPVSSALPDPTAGPVACHTGGVTNLERVRYFARQLLTPDDLTQEQEYFRAKLRRHNRLLHGWGVVCGCEVRATETDWTVSIEPGYVLGPQGDEILIDRSLSVDLSRQGLDGNAVIVCGEELDPWCSSVRVARRAGETVFIAIAYSECPSRPVRVQPAGCGCDGSQCEYSRIRDGFVVRVLTKLPTSYANMQPSRSPLECPESGIRECPDCVTEPWVVLAAMTLSGKTIRPQDIDNTTHRRYVAAFGNWWFTCAGPRPPTSPTPGPSGAGPAPAPGR